MLTIGSIVDGKYKILNRIGQGGMSTVYLAVNEKANKPWAIKAIRKDDTMNLEVVKRGLMSEVEILRKLKHRNLPSIVDIIEDHDEFLIVMDYVEGRTLKEIVDEEGKLAQEDVIDYGMQLCDVLSYLHERPSPIIYRDLKPSNIMLRPDGRIILIDFGTAREYKDGGQDTMCLGTQGYAAPEQYGGFSQTDARTDIYSLGATLYHLVTGHNPSLPPYEILPIRHWDESLAAGLEAILLKCTRLNPNERYQDCREVLYDLKNYHTLDENYLKTRISRFRLFAFGVIITVLSGVISACGFVKEHHYKGLNYEKYVEEAASFTDPAQKETAYDNAIRLDPSKETAYMDYLDFCLLDEELDESEVKSILEIINRIPSSGTKSCLELLRENEAGYTDFCYEMGVAYFFEYNGLYGKSAGKIWFDRALESKKYLAGSKRNRAKIYSEIGSYYDLLGRKNLTGELSEDYYQKLYEDLKKLNSYEVKDFGGNYVTALTLYQEIAVIIGEHATQMLYGQTASAKDLKEQLSAIEKRISDLSVKGMEDRVTSLETQIEIAYKSIDAGSAQMSHKEAEE